MIGMISNIYIIIISSSSITNAEKHKLLPFCNVKMP